MSGPLITRVTASPMCRWMARISRVVTGFLNRSDRHLCGQSASFARYAWPLTVAKCGTVQRLGVGDPEAVTQEPLRRTGDAPAVLGTSSVGPDDTSDARLVARELPDWGRDARMEFGNSLTAVGTPR